MELKKKKSINKNRIRDDHLQEICNFYIFPNFVDPLFPLVKQLKNRSAFWFSDFHVSFFLFLLLLGNKNLLKHHSMWKDLIESFEKRHCVVNESTWPKN